MENYYIDFVLLVDIAFVGISLGIALLIMHHSFSHEFIGNFSRRRKEAAVDFLKHIEFEEPNVFELRSQKLINKLPVAEIQYLLYHCHETFSDELSGKFIESIRKSIVVQKIETFAQIKRNKWRRIESIRILGFVHTDRAFRILESAAKDEDEDVSYYALLALGHIKTTESAQILIQALYNQHLSGYKIASILESFPPFIVELLGGELDSQNPHVCFWALKLLSRFRVPVIEDRVIALARSEDPNLRAAACECLGIIGRREAEHVLKKCLHDTVWYVRMHAVRSLVSILREEGIGETFRQISDSHVQVSDAVKKCMIQHIHMALPYIRMGLLSHDLRIRKDCLEIVHRSGYIGEVYSAYLSTDPERRKDAGEMIAMLVAAGSFFGLLGHLKKTAQNQQKIILEYIGQIDPRLSSDLRINCDKTLVEMAL